MNKQNKISEPTVSQSLSSAKPTCAGLFSGIGGFCEGFEKIGFETLWLNEFNPSSNLIYLENRPKAEIFDFDVRDLSVEKNKLKPVDVLHAGFPCQSFSGAGARKGFEDDRGKLFFEIIRLLEEFDKNAPKVLVLENTPNILIGNKGAWISEIIAQLQGAGYWISEENCVLLDTKKNFGLPQRRERVFIFAVHKSFFDGNPFVEYEMEIPEISPSPLTDILKLDEEQEAVHYLDKKNRFGQIIYESLEAKPRYSLAQLRKSYVREIKAGECPTLTANMGKGGHNVPFVLDDFGLRRLTEFECAKLQGFSANFKLTSERISSKAKVYEMIGNSVSPAVSYFIASKVRNFLEANKNV